MIQEPTLRKWHRQAGVVLAPLILLQAVSGLFLSIEWLSGLHTAAGELLPGASPLAQFWDWVFINVHYGGGRAGRSTTPWWARYWSGSPAREDGSI